MAKSGLIPAKPQQPNPAADAWVNGGASTAKGSSAGQGSQEETMRMTFDISKSLHRRVMLDCATKGVKMATVLRQMIEERWPADGSR